MLAISAAAPTLTAKGPRARCELRLGLPDCTLAAARCMLRQQLRQPSPAPSHHTPPPFAGSHDAAASARPPARPPNTGCCTIGFDCGDWLANGNLRGVGAPALGATLARLLAG